MVISVACSALGSSISGVVTIACVLSSNSVVLAELISDIFSVDWAEVILPVSADVTAVEISSVLSTEDIDSVVFSDVNSGDVYFVPPELVASVSALLSVLSGTVLVSLDMPVLTSDVSTFPSVDVEEDANSVLLSELNVYVNSVV